jgi:hypothetical protein
MVGFEAGGIHFRSRRVRFASSADWPAYTVERWPIERPTPYAKNARTPLDAQIEQLRKGDTVLRLDGANPRA